MVKYLVEEAKADAFIQENGNTLLHSSAGFGHLDIVKYLVKKNPASVNTTNSNGETPVYWAAWFRHLDIAKYLVKKNPADVNTTNSHGETPVHLAVWHGHHDVVEYLEEEAHADAFIKGWRDDATPFHWIASQGWLDVVKYLVKKNPAGVNIKDNNGRTALDFAKDICAVDDWSSVVEYLKTIEN